MKCTTLFSYQNKPRYFSLWGTEPILPHSALNGFKLEMIISLRAQPNEISSSQNRTLTPDLCGILHPVIRTRHIRIRGVHDQVLHITP